MRNYLQFCFALNQAKQPFYFSSKVFSMVLVLGLMMSGNKGWSQTTYTWNQAGDGNWSTATNWTPTRTTPATNDIMVINNGGTKTISEVQTQTIGKLQISGSTSVTLRPQAAGNRVLTISTVATDAITVAAGSTLTVTGIAATDKTLTITTLSSVGLEANISGTVKVGLDNGQQNADGVFTKGASATIKFNSGSVYEHARNSGNIPVATWALTATCLVSGVTDNMPGNDVQNFGNFTWNCTGQTANLNLANAIAILGNLTVASTGSGTNTLRLINDATRTIGGDYLQTGGRVTIRNNMAHALTVPGDFILSGGEFINQGTGNGNINVAGDYTHTGGTLNGEGNSLTVVFNGTGTQTYTSGGTVSGTTHYLVNSGATLHMADETTVVTGTSFTLSSGATLGITSPEGITTTACGTGSTCGNIRTTSRTFNAGANYRYNGSGAQNTGNGLPATLTGNLEIDNDMGVSLSAAQTINSTGDLLLTDGILNTTTANLLTLGDNVTVTPVNGSGASFVNGPLRKIGDDAFVFPIGSGSTWAPISISAPGSMTAAFQAQYFAASPPSMTLGTGVAEINQKEYWDLDRVAGTSSVSVTLNFTGNSMATMPDLANLRVARFDSTLMTPAWVSMGNTGTTGTETTSGTVTSGAVSSFSFFTLGSSVALNPLPIELISFSATPKSTTVELDWSTGSETNNAFFDIERSPDGRDFSRIGKVAGAGNSQVTLDYTFTDILPLNGWNYYRLRQVDANGDFSYSPVEAVLMDKGSVSDRLMAFPNPASTELNLKTDRLIQPGDRFEIVDNTGRRVLLLPAIEAVSAPVNVSALPAGTYVVRLLTATGTVHTPFVKQ